MRAGWEERWGQKEGGIRKGHEGDWRNWICHYFDCGDGFISVHICQNWPNWTWWTCSLLHVRSIFIALFWDVIPILFSLEKRNMLQIGTVWYVDGVLWEGRWGNTFSTMNLCSLEIRSPHSDFSIPPPNPPVHQDNPSSMSPVSESVLLSLQKVTGRGKSSFPFCAIKQDKPKIRGQEQKCPRPLHTTETSLWQGFALNWVMGPSEWVESDLGRDHRLRGGKNTWGETDSHPSWPHRKAPCFSQPPHPQAGTQQENATLC